MPVDFSCAKYIIGIIKETDFRLPESDVPDEEFEERSTERWAIDDLTRYLKEHWFSDIPVELISDYIDDCQFRYGRYFDHPLGNQYRIAKRTAEAVMLHFI